MKRLISIIAMLITAVVGIALVAGKMKRKQEVPPEIRE